MELLFDATGLSLRGLALALGVDRMSVRRHRDGGLDETLADEWAVALGFHPAEVWPDWLTRKSPSTDEAEGDPPLSHAPPPVSDMRRKRARGSERDMDYPQGRQVIGRFVAVETVRRRATPEQQAAGQPGTAVPGMFELVLIEDRQDREWKHGIGFFETDQEGEVTKISRTIAEGSVSPGDLVSVRIKSSATAKGTKAYSNDTAISMVVLVPSGTALAG
jgi:hypothetical protein